MLSRTVASGVHLEQDISRLGVSMPPKVFVSGCSRTANRPVSTHIVSTFRYLTKYMKRIYHPLFPQVFMPAM